MPPSVELRLDVPREALLDRCSSLIADAWRGFDLARPGQPQIDPRIRSLLEECLPSDPSPSLAVLTDASHVLDQSLAQPRPRWFAFVGSSGLETGVLADALASCFDVNLASWAAAASLVEAQSLRWLAEFLGYPGHDGAFTSGGTVSNLTALAAARERALPGLRRRGAAGAGLAVYASVESHHSIARAAELLGIGSEGVRRLPIDGDRRLVPEAVAHAIDVDRDRGIVPIAVVATAGTTLTGAVDPIGALADVASERGVWLHIDGAYGLPAAAAPSARALFSGIERADSLALDAHKWLYVPKACGAVLVRDPGALVAAFGHDEGYFPHDDGWRHPVDSTLEYSRPLRALKLWLAFRIYGATAFRHAIERNLRQARFLHELVREEMMLAPLSGPPQLSVVPFRHLAGGRSGLDKHNLHLAQAIQRDGRAFVSSAEIDGCVYLRPCIVNFRTSDCDVRALVEVALELGACA